MDKKLDTVFRWCNDVEEMRTFYSDHLQLDETFYQNDEANGWLTYQLSETLLVFIRTETPLPKTAVFAKNPAYTGGEAIETSWVLQVPLEAFDETVSRLQAAQVPEYSPPFSNRPGHKQYIIRDPMGMTIELYAVDPEAAQT